jgi:hypothetical protein
VLVVSLGLAIANRSPGGSGVEAMGRQLAPQTNTNWWLDDPIVPEPFIPPSLNDENAIQDLDFSSDNRSAE